MEDVKESINKISKITNKEIIGSYLNFYKHSKQSIIVRRSCLNYFFIRFNYTGHIFDINKRILMNYFNYLNQLENISLKTKKMKWIILKGLCQFVNEYYEEELDKPIIIPKFMVKWKPTHKEPESNKKVIATKEELLAISDYCKNKSLRNYMIFKMFIDIGLRIGELVNIDYINTFISERKVKTRGKTGIKTYYFSKLLQEQLKDFIKYRKLIETESKALFISKSINRMRVRDIEYILQGCLRDLGIVKRISPHTFRRSINTYRKLMGCSLEDRKILLNHKLNDVNTESYINFTDKDYTNLHDKWYPYKI